jgi:hypothetical protein
MCQTPKVGNEEKKNCPKKGEKPDHPVMTIVKRGNFTIPQNDNH